MTVLGAVDWQPLPCRAAGRVFAVGDVHGRLDLLSAALDLVTRLAAEGEGGADGGPAATLVLLGDLIDRGPRSIACLDRAERGLPGLPLVCLAGNHEQMLLQSLDGDPDAPAVWLANGGTAVLAELGGAAPMPGRYGHDRAAWVSWLRAALGARRLAFLGRLAPWHRSGDVLFVHAGLPPASGLEESLSQPARPASPLRDLDEDRSIYWVRWPFLEHDGPYPGGLFVVHGHTPHRRLEVAGHRLCLDLGSAQTGRVGVAQIEGDRVRLFAVGA